MPDPQTLEPRSYGAPAARVLVVEDEDKVARAVAEGLGQHGYDVVIAANGEDGARAAAHGVFDLIVLDLMLPGRDGIDLLSTWRRGGLTTPVLILTARDGLSDRLRGFDAGADDYLVKPFAFPELLARLRALARRGSRVAVRHRLADLVVDQVERRVTRGGQELRLTPKEFDFLAYLVRHAGETVSREMLARDVWQEFARGTTLDNVIDVHVLRLRRKVDQEFSPRLIHTVRGLGFVAKVLPDQA